MIGEKIFKSNWKLAQSCFLIIQLKDPMAKFMSEHGVRSTSTITYTETSSPNTDKFDFSSAHSQSTFTIGRANVFRLHLRGEDSTSKGIITAREGRHIAMLVRLASMQITPI